MLHAGARSVGNNQGGEGSVRPGIDSGNLDVADGDGDGGFSDGHESIMPDCHAQAAHRPAKVAG
jgi:hypothetical protein